MRGVITGFNSFGQHEENPTQALVEQLPASFEHGGRTIRLTTAILDSCCDHAWRRLAIALEGENAPSFVIMTGLAETRTSISLERFALNIQDYRIADNGGHQWQDRRLDDNGPDALRTGLSLAPLRDDLRSAGYACDISNFAGAFLCNEVYYLAMRWLAQRGLPMLALFMHFPPLTAYASAAGTTAAADTPDPESTLSRYRQAVLQVAGHMVGKSLAGGGADEGRR